MKTTLPQVVEPDQPTAQVLPFRRPAPAQDNAARLSIRDRMEVLSFQDIARGLGFDRLVVHERQPCDPPDLDSFLGVYRRGEAWSCWCLVRRGAEVKAWASVSGAEHGPWTSFTDALRDVLGAEAAPALACNVVRAFG